jgi:hypothetical protein
MDRQDICSMFQARQGMPGQADVAVEFGVTPFSHGAGSAGLLETTHSILAPERTVSVKQAWHTVTLPTANGAIAVGGILLQKVLSAELFREANKLSSYGGIHEIAVQCQLRWAALASALSGLPESAEILMVLGSQHHASQTSAQVSIAFLGLDVGSRYCKHSGIVRRPVRVYGSCCLLTWIMWSYNRSLGIRLRQGLCRGW